jgi:uncharacterized protein (TIGR03435 family)
VNYLYILTVAVTFWTSLPWQTKAGPALAFEAAIIKENKDPSAPSKRGCSETGSNIPKGRCQARNIWMRSIIALAYGISVDDVGDRIFNRPSWIESERYDLEAKAENSNASTEELESMLQTLLAERLKLKVHFEMRNLEQFTLVVGKNGPTLHESDGHAPFEVKTRLVSEGASKPFYKATATNSTITAFLSYIKPTFGHRILDNTALRGHYDFELTWASDASDFVTSPIDLAFQQQLAFRLESKKVPTSVLVIDHIERPSPN